MGARTDAAQAEVLAAREALGTEVVGLRGATREAFDVPARIRRAPAQSAAVVGGAAFLLVGGPGRVLRRLRRAVRGPEADLPKSMLPEEVEQVVSSLGSDGKVVRGALERGFAEYLDKRGSFAKRDVRSAGAEAIAGIIRLTGSAAGVQLARRLASGDSTQVAQTLDRLRRIVGR